MKDQGLIRFKTGLLGYKPPLARRQNSFSTILENRLRMKRNKISYMNIGIAMEDPIARRLHLRSNVSFAKKKQILSCKQELDMNMNLITNSFSAELKIATKSIIKSVYKTPEIVTPSSSMIQKSAAHGIIAACVEQNVIKTLPFVKRARTPYVPTALDFDSISNNHCATNVINFRTL